MRSAADLDSGETQSLAVDSVLTAKTAAVDEQVAEDATT